MPRGQSLAPIPAPLSPTALDVLGLISVAHIHSHKTAAGWRTEQAELQQHIELLGGRGLLTSSRIADGRRRWHLTPHGYSALAAWLNGSRRAAA